MERIEPGSIVVAADGSDHARRALHWAVEQATLEHRRLTVLTAGEGAQAVADHATELVGRLQPGLPVRALTCRRDPREALVDVSSRAHLLVLGSRGRGPVASLLLGSVGAAVTAHAECPVVVCRPDGGSVGRGVVVGADGTPESLPVIGFAYRQAALRHLPLTVLHCFWDPVAAVAQYHQARGEPVDAPELAGLEAMLAESVAGFAETFPEVAVTLGLEHGLADEALTPPGYPWDLVVVGRHPMTTLSRVVTGSIATSVVERARTTVAVVPQAPPSS